MRLLPGPLRRRDRDEEKGDRNGGNGRWRNGRTVEADEAAKEREAEQQKERKRDQLLEVPIHALGIQSHLEPVGE